MFDVYCQFAADIRTAIQIYYLVILSLGSNELHMLFLSGCGWKQILCIHTNEHIYDRGRQPFPSREPKSNSARYGGLY